MKVELIFLSTYSLVHVHVHSKCLVFIKYGDQLNILEIFEYVSVSARRK